MENTSAKTSKTIMIVDDEIYFRNLLRDILVEAGFTIIAEASNCDEAIDEYRKHCPEITIMDIFMPGENGIDALKEIISIDKNAKVLIYTGLGFDEDAEVALRAGAKEVILKTFSPAEVTAVINKVLAGE